MIELTEKEEEGILMTIDSILDFSDFDWCVTEDTDRISLELHVILKNLILYDKE